MQWGSGQRTGQQSAGMASSITYDQLEYANMCKQALQLLCLPLGQGVLITFSWQVRKQGAVGVPAIAFRPWQILPARQQELLPAGLPQPGTEIGSHTYHRL